MLSKSNVLQSNKIDFLPIYSIPKQKSESLYQAWGMDSNLKHEYNTSIEYNIGIRILIKMRSLQAASYML